MSSILLFLLALGSPSLYGQPTLHHIPPPTATAGQNLPVEFSLTGHISRIMMAKVYFRNETETTFRSVNFVSQAAGWRGEIPGRFVRGTALYYFISVLLDDQTILTWPVTNPYNNPYRLEILKAVTRVPPALPGGEKKPQLPMPPKPETQAPVLAKGDTLQLLSPDANGTYRDDEVMLAVSYFSESAILNPKAVRIHLDGQDITAKAEISSALISLDPPELAPGPHTVVIKAQDSKGRVLSPLQFRFFVESTGGEVERAAQPKSFQAHTYVDALYETFSGQDESIGMAGVDFSGKVSSFNYRGTLFLTSLESGRQQPRDRFGFSISSRLIGVSVGDSYPKLHDLIIAGKRVRGITGYLHLGLVNVDMIYGQLQRAIPATFSRSLSGGTVPRTYGTFSRSVLGVRPSLGDGRVFQFGLTLARIRDDSTSVKMGLRPKDNLVFGPDIKLALLGGKMVFNASAAMSLLTNDISYGPSTTEDLKRVFNEDVELPIDPADLADLLIINDSTVPLDPTSNSSLAYHLNLQFNHGGHFLTLGYRSIGKEYNSLANPWLRKDLRGFFVQDRFRLYQNKFFANLGFEQYADNFSKVNGNPQMDMRTVNAGLSLFPGGSYPQITFSLRDQLRDNHVRDVTSETIAVSTLLDTLIMRDEREKVWYRDLMVQISQNFRLLNARHQVSASYVSSRTIDEFREDRSSGQFSPDLSSRIALLSLSSQYTIPFISTLSFSSNKSEGAAFNTITYTTYALHGEYRWLNERLSTSAEIRLISILQAIIGANDLDLSRNQMQLGLRWNISAGQSLLCEGQIWRYAVGNQSGGDHSDTDSMIRIRYDRYF